MAEQSGFFNANLVNGEYDRVYLAESFAKYFASFISNGVFSGKLSELGVSQLASPAMKVEVLSGFGFINGYWYENTSNLSFNIDAADGVLNRIDSIVLQWSKSLRSIKAVIKKGTPASAAAAPIVQRDANIYELKIADIYIAAGATSITQANITDKRADTSVCGFVTGLINQIDSSEFESLINSTLKEVERASTDEIRGIANRLNDLVKDQSAFGNLALKVDGLASEIALASQSLGFSKKNIITYPFKETTKTVSGVTFTDNGDGTITVNGTPTETAIFQLCNIKLDTSKKYFISDGVNASQNTYYTQLYATDATSLPTSNANKPIVFTPEDLTYSVRIVIKTAVSNLTFKPMIYRAEILDSAWKPYKPSVNEMIQEDTVEVGCFYRINHVTGIKEWINPPFKSGIEYCTTERWNGKPVYQKTFYTASLPNKNVMMLDTKTTWNKLISVEGYALDNDDLTVYPFPVILYGEAMPIAVVSRIESDGRLVITTNANASHLEAYITIKYVKS